MATRAWARLAGGIIGGLALAAGVAPALSVAAVSVAAVSVAAVSVASPPWTGGAVRDGGTGQAGLPAGPPAPNPGIIGRITLSGYGSKLASPTAPTRRPLYTDCHDLIDPAFQGTCTTVHGKHGWVAGVVEMERGAASSQERDLVWRRQGRHWDLALVRVLTRPSTPSGLWSAPVRPGSDPYLAFVSAVARPGFGADLSLVSTAGKVELYRFLGQGFAQVPSFGGLLTYVPGFTEAVPADSYFDQALIGFVDGGWRVISQQYVPYFAALAQHRGIVTGPGVIAAR